MNSISGEQLLKALNAVFGKELKTVSPVGQNICMDDGRAAIILKGAMDLFIARHRENNTHGFPMALCDRMNAGTLVPPFHRNPLTLFFGRCLPDTEIVLLPMNDVLKKMHEGDNVLWNCCLKFAENAGWSKLPKTVPAFLQSFSDLCVDSFVQLQKTEGLTRTLIRNNFNEQKRKERGVIHVFSSLFGRTKEYTAPFDPSDPAAAAAAYTAEKSGIEDFVLEKEQTLERRIAWSMDHQNLRITPVVLNGPWYKECFAPMMIISADGKNAYCAYCNKHNDPVAWDGSSGELFEIDHQFSKTIQTIGWNFVKPLPNGPVSWGSMLHFFFGFFKPSVPR